MYQGCQSGTLAVQIAPVAVSLASPEDKNAAPGHNFRTNVRTRVQDAIHES